LAIFFGLLAAFAWAGADFFARQVARRIGAYRAFVLMQCVGLILLSLYLSFARDPHATSLAALWAATRRDWRWALAAGLLNIAASLSLYRAFAVGKLALVTPISASYPALTVVLALASGERLKTTAGCGIGIVLAGVILAVVPRGNLANSASAAWRARSGTAMERGVGWALAAALGFGVLFWVLGFRVTGALGGVLPVWVIRLMGATLLLTLALRRRRQPVLPRGGIWPPLVGSALLDTTAFVSNTLGLTTGHVSVVTVLASLFGAMAVLLAWLFLGERLSGRQWLGIVMILAGVALVSI